jgi:putative transposase
MDFVSDQLALRRRFRTLNIIDDKSRECLSIEVGTSLTGAQVVRVLDRLVQLRGRPEVIVMDNGPEFTRHALADWSIEMGIKLHFIRPGKPTENTFAESFNSIFRRECFNENWSFDMADARHAVESWRSRYNDRRPHGTLGNLTLSGVFTTSRTCTGPGGVTGARPVPPTKVGSHPARGTHVPHS